MKLCCIWKLFYLTYVLAPSFLRVMQRVEAMVANPFENGPTRSLLDAGEFPLIETVLRELPGKAYKQVSRSGAVLIAQGCNSQQKASVRR